MTTDPSAKKKIILNIQYLRAFAALNVVLFHIVGAAEEHGFSLNIFDFMIGWGANGVDLFFVISGFIMVFTHAHAPKTPWLFLKNRVLKIVPLYWILTFFLVLLFFVQPHVFTNLQFDLSRTITSLFFLSQLVSGTTPVLFLGWTLEYEMLFYTIFALGLFLRSLRTSIFFVTAVLIALVAFDSADAIVLEFGLGMLIGLFVTGNNQLNFSKVLFGSGLLLLGSSLCYEVNTSYRVFIWGIPSMMIVLSVIYLPARMNRFLLLLGNASYSIYLIQFFTIPFFFKFTSAIFPTLPGDLMVPLSLCFTAAAGCCVYLAIEKPTAMILNRSW